MFKEILLRRWVVIANAILLLYSIGTTLRDAFPNETQQKYQLNLLLHQWSLQMWITIFAVGNFLIVLHGAWLAIKKREAERDRLAAKLAEIEKAKPRIKLSEPNAVRILPNVWQTYGDVRLGPVPFLVIRFVNEPSGPYPSAKANDVRATISYYRDPDNTHLLSIDGRWSDSDQPSAIDPLKSKSHLLAASFGIGQKHDLDIAYRDAETGKYFAWNNDNYQYKFFRCEEHLLTGNKFRVDIHLLGGWVDERYSLEFRTTEAGFALD
jgi:hypothetical protein